MSVKPILFNTVMVRAILCGSKTVTRRLVKAQHLKVLESQYHTKHPDVSDKTLIEKLCEPPFKKGDILYVRETWAEWTGGYVYKAGTPPFTQAGESPVMRWKPSIHMPKEAARIWLRVTGVRVERLQEIDAKQILREGINSNSNYMRFVFYQELWDSTIKKSNLDRYGWSANPLVWVIEFGRYDKPETEGYLELKAIE